MRAIHGLRSLVQEHMSKLDWRAALAAAHKLVPLVDGDEKARALCSQAFVCREVRLFHMDCGLGSVCGI